MKKHVKIFPLLVVILFSVMLLGGCGGSSDETFDNLVNFQGFKDEVDDEFNSPPFRVGIFIGHADGETERIWTDAPPAERASKIPKNAEFVGIVFQIEIVEDSGNVKSSASEGNKDWVTLRDVFVYNDKSSPGAPRNFNRFKNVRLELDGLEDDFIFFVNDVETDAAVMLQGEPEYPALPPNIWQDDPRGGTRDTHYQLLPADVVSLVNAIPGNGTAYEISIGEVFNTLTHDNVGNHIQGFAYWNNELFLTHSDLDHGKIYRYWYNGEHQAESDEVWHDYNHPGGVQVIGDYLLVSAAEKADDSDSLGAVIAHYLWNFTQEFLLFGRSGDAYTNSAVGITDLNPSLSYYYQERILYYDDKMAPHFEDIDDWTEEENAGFKKYIIGLVNYEANQIEIHHFPRTNYLQDLLDKIRESEPYPVIQTISIDNPPGNFNNMNLFRDVNDDVWMIAFLEEGNSSPYTNLYVYKLTFNVYNATENRNEKRFHTSVSPAGDPKRLTAVTPESANINGRYGASLYFDGENLHVFISQRNASYLSGPKVGRIFYNHWGKID